MRFASENHDTVRSYTSSDRSACLALFDSNAPTFFTASERDDFARFLDEQTAACSYLVIVRGDRIVACGGHAIRGDGVTAVLCWGMVDRKLHGTGLGNMLTKERLRAAEAAHGVTQVRIDTSQHTQGFYARFGFQAEAITPEGYGSGLDRWDMLLRF